ncbi:MAG TPA: sigma-70 family RNA polymerase sigma factor [Firmicutes bacterium]|nr:sigma-70 family RNA polymerase sigma factor [Bacillota bacterium]
MEEDKASVSDLLKRAMDGDLEARGALLAKYKPFVLSAVSKVLGRFITDCDDEVSIGLQAFDEALLKFRPSKSTSFLAFAGLVIRRRLVDFIRQQKQKRGNEISLDETLNIEDVDQFEAVERRDEIERFKAELAGFGIRLEEVAENCPRRLDARERAQQAARLLAEDDSIWAYVQRRGHIPISRLEGASGLHRKTVERHRVYIIAIALIYRGPYFYLRDYLEH